MNGRASAAMARTVRRLPGYTAVSRPALRAVRSSPMIADLVSRLFPPRFDPAGSVLPLRAGALTGRDVNRLPIVGFLLLDSDEDKVATLIEDVTQLQRRTSGFRPVLLLDGPHFAAVRAADMVMEHLVPARDWHGAIAGAVEHDRYLAQRLLDLQRHYLAWHICRVGVEGIDALDRQVLAELADALPADLQVTPSALDEPAADGAGDSDTKTTGKTMGKTTDRTAGKTTEPTP